jgi:hypothetical protein
MVNIYEEKIIKQTEDFEMDYSGAFAGQVPQAGRCQFCGHGIGMGYQVKGKTSGKILIVGCDCVVNLTKLDATKAKIFLHEDAIRRNILKHQKVIDFLKAKYDCKPHWEVEFLDRKSQDETTTMKLEENKAVFRCNGKFGCYSWHRDRLNDFLIPTIRNVPEYSIVRELLRKIMSTTTVNKYWFEQYEKITSIKLKGVEL